MPKTRCFAHYHMNFSQYGFYEHCRALFITYQKLIFDGRKFADRFTGKGVSKSSAYRLAEALEKMGWLVPMDRVEGGSVPKRRRRANGCFRPTVYKVLSHDEWAADHGTAACHSQNGS